MRLTEQQAAEIEAARGQRSPTARPTVAALEAMLFQAIPALDYGFIRVIDYMGDDAAIVQAARVSYGAGNPSRLRGRRADPLSDAPHVCDSNVAEESGICRGGGVDAGVGDRGEYRDLQRSGCGTAAATAVRSLLKAGADLGDASDVSASGRRVSRLSRLAAQAKSFERWRLGVRRVFRSPALVSRNRWTGASFPTIFFRPSG